MALVLIVDDHVDTCRIVRRLIQTLGEDAECVHSGAAALAFLAARRPALVLMDVAMPGMDGFETLEALRRHGGPAADVPVVMFSAFDDDASQARARALGAADYWVKGGFKWAALTERLRRFVPARLGGAETN